MNVLKALEKRRTIRKFKQKKVPLFVVNRVLSAARLYPSAANLQYIECVVVKDRRMVDEIFQNTRWAGYLYPRGTPQKGERPLMFIAVVLNNQKSPETDLRDVGAFVQSMLLGFLECGLSSCWIASCQKEQISKLLKLPPHCVLDSVVAVGFPGQKSKPVSFRGDVKYYVDKKGILCVPKRALKDMVFVDTYPGLPKAKIKTGDSPSARDKKKTSSRDKKRGAQMVYAWVTRGDRR